MGGPATCNVMISGNTAEETVTNAMKHLEEAHPELAASIKANTPEANAAWMTDFTVKWNALPEMQ